MPIYNISVPKNTVEPGNVPSRSICNISGSGNLTIKGTIGAGSIINKAGHGDLILSGIVGERVIFNQAGQGKVIFAHQPPKSVIMNGSNFHMQTAASESQLQSDLEAKVECIRKLVTPSKGGVSVVSISNGTGVNFSHKKSYAFFSKDGGAKFACIKGEGSVSGLQIGDANYDSEIKNGIVTITKNGVPTHYKGNSSYIKPNGQVVIDKKEVITNDPRIMSDQEVSEHYSSEHSCTQSGL